MGKSDICSTSDAQKPASRDGRGQGFQEVREADGTGFPSVRLEKVRDLVDRRCQSGQNHHVHALDEVSPVRELGGHQAGLQDDLPFP